MAIEMNNTVLLEHCEAPNIEIKLFQIEIFQSLYFFLLTLHLN